MYYNFKKLYKKKSMMLEPLDVERVIHKWSNVLDNANILKNKFLREEISKIMEIYQIMENDVPKIAPTPSPYVRNNEPSFPEGYIELPYVIKMMKDNIDVFIRDNNDIKLNIINEYYNVVTGKKGYLLENDIRIEDGVFLNEKHQEKVDMELKKIIDNTLEFILEPSKRIVFEREKKLKRILKNKK